MKIVTAEKVAFIAAAIGFGFFILSVLLFVTVVALMSAGIVPHQWARPASFIMLAIAAWLMFPAGAVFLTIIILEKPTR